MYQALAGDVSLRPRPYVDKWAPRVGGRAARLQWFSRTGTLVAGVGGLAIGLPCIIAGGSPPFTWLPLVGQVLLAVAAVVSLIGFLCVMLSVSAMSEFFGVHLTLRTSPLLRDDQFSRWCQENDLPVQGQP